MRKITLGIVLIGTMLPILSRAQNYVINGKIGHLSSPAKAYLMGGPKTDSAVIKNGVFTFKGVVDEPRPTIMVINKRGTGILREQMDGYTYPLKFYIEPGKISITSPDSIDHSKVVAGTLNADYFKLKSQLHSSDSALEALKDYILSATPEMRQSKEYGEHISNVFAAVGKQQKRVFLKFIQEHPNSLMSLYVIKCYGGYDHSMLLYNNPETPGLDELDSLCNSLSASVRSSKPGSEFHNMIRRLKTVDVGFKAPEFSQPDTSGKVVSLQDFRGKYVLIDFWASWCGPCRAENPNVIKAFNTYKDKGFTVLGVSLDNADGKKAWLEAIQDDHLAWAQVSDLKGWKNEVAQLYGVLSIPQNFLVDPYGNIVGKNLRGNNLDEKLKELLGGTAREFVVKGKFGDLSSPAKAYLFYSDGGTVKIDSTGLEQGMFTLKGKSSGQESKVFLTVASTGNRMSSKGVTQLRFFTDTTVISVVAADSLSVPVVTGGQLNLDEDNLKTALAKVKNDKEDEDELTDEEKDIYLNFIKSHPGSIVSLDALNKLGGQAPDPAIVEPAFNSLEDAVRSSKVGREYAEKLVGWKKVAVGQQAPDFTLYDTTGKAVSLHDFKGKYILVDFWASWCPPCRAENPTVAAALAAYRKKNFTVLGVTMDNPDKKAAWLKAIHEDHMTWTQVGSQEMWKNAAAELYSVNSIPQNYLISPDGKILAKNLRGKALPEKLKELFGE